MFVHLFIHVTGQFILSVIQACVDVVDFSVVCLSVHHMLIPGVDEQLFIYFHPNTIACLWR